MSRSFKKHPWVTDHKVHNTMKKFANKKVRHTDLPSKGKAYKKCEESYNICDYKWTKTKEEAIQEYEEALKHPEKNYYNAWILERYPTLKAWLSHWKKHFLSK